MKRLMTTIAMSSTAIVAIALVASFAAFPGDAHAAKAVCGDTFCQGNEPRTCPEDCGGVTPDDEGNFKDIKVCTTLTDDVLDGVVSDDDGAYCDSKKNKVSALVGRNRHVHLAIGSASARELHLDLAMALGCSCSTDVDLDGDDVCDGWANTICEDGLPDLGGFPNLNEVVFNMSGEDLDDLPFGCTHEDNAILGFTDGVDDWVLRWGRYDSAGGPSHCPNSDPIVVKREDDNQWTFTTTGDHLACLYRKENPPHGATEYHGQFTVPFSGQADSQGQTAPKSACLAQPDRDRRGRTISADDCFTNPSCPAP